VREVHRRITKNDASPSVFDRAKQNVTTTAMLMRQLPKASTLEGKKLHNELRVLLDRAAVQQAESSAQRRDAARSSN
jgi:hypothetical protein